jgi:hypothetical protein
MKAIVSYFFSCYNVFVLTVRTSFSFRDCYFTWASSSSCFFPNYDILVVFYFLMSSQNVSFSFKISLDYLRHCLMSPVSYSFNLLSSDCLWWWVSSTFFTLTSNSLLNSSISFSNLSKPASAGYFPSVCSY